MSIKDDEQGRREQSPAAESGDGFQVPEQGPNQAGGGEGEDLLSQLSVAHSEARDLEDRMLRLAAEFENFKKRIRRERESDFKYAEESLLRELLPTVDNLERAIEQGRDSAEASALLEGVEMTCSGLLATLEKFGLKALAGKGETFDPNYHEALAMEPSAEAPANTILNEFQKGYLYKDRLLRAAKVVVSSGPPEAK